MVKRWFQLTILFLAVYLASYGQATIDSIDETEMKPHQILDIQDNVSLVKLIATPEKYDGKRIQVIGFLHLEFEGNAIYLHQEDYKHSLSANSFWVSFSSKLSTKKNMKKFSNRYVVIIGTFKANEKGHMGLFSGTLDNIVRLELWDLERK
jgi:hypothetical protein